ALPCASGSFAQQPSNQAVCSGQPASFTVDLPGATGYRWRKNGVNLTNGGTISGANSATLNISAVSPADIGSYDCQASTSCGEPISNAATLAVNVAPGFTLQPSNQSGQTGDTIVLTAAASGSPSFSWTRDTNPVVDGATGSGSTISGATTGTLTITNAQPADAGSYVATATNGCGSVPSNAATVGIGCPADFNGDGSVDGDDVIGFFGAWDINDAAADFNGDGSVDGDDVIGFFGNWDAGC
ncbi:MAG: immunoglobulin domain-containing protein, partial [Phycisphaerales bacterium]